MHTFTFLLLRKNFKRVNKQKFNLHWKVKQIQGKYYTENESQFKACGESEKKQIR